MNTKSANMSTIGTKTEWDGRGKSQWDHKTLTAGQIMSLRFNRAVAYKAEQYKMQPPPVCTTRWDDEAWMNWVQFDNESLTGFLPYTNQSAED